MHPFTGPLGTHQPTAADPASTHTSASHSTASTSTATSEDLVREALQRRIDCPLTGLLAETGNSASAR